MIEGYLKSSAHFGAEKILSYQFSRRAGVTGFRGTFECRGRMILKIYYGSQIHLQSRELYFLDLIRGHGVGPRIEQYGILPDGGSYILMEQLEGPTQSKLKRQSNLQNAIYLAKRLHSVPIGADPSYKVSMACHADIFRARMRALRKIGIKIPITEKALQLKEDRLSHYVICHNDIHIENVIVNHPPKLVDFSHSIVSFPSVDYGGIVSHYCAPKSVSLSSVSIPELHKGGNPNPPHEGKRLILFFALARTLRRIMYLSKNSDCPETHRQIKNANYFSNRLMAYT